MSSSLSGQRLGNFEIGPLVGSGGMGEVYRARDSRLNRDVAIKVLLPSVAGDSERLARFNREAQVLASLNHPNIAHIHGVEQGPDGPLLVLEFVSGPTLADRIAAGPLPLDEAIPIARQIVDALEAAHERGIIHRDLKPANVKVDDNGTVKVLDFGLAKALDPLAATSGDAINSPTITSPAMTLAGLIIGTAAYMSPEQAKGRVVDKRSDVWSFGCVFYEMLTGKRAFEGEDVTDTIAAVVRGEPDWRALPVDTPGHVRLLLQRCLEKDRRKRAGDISVVRFLLDERLESPLAGGAKTDPSASPRRAERFAATAFVLGTVAAGALAWALWPKPVAMRTMRFTLRPDASEAIVLQGADRDIAMAPDGSFIVYRSSPASGAGPPHLIVRALDELKGRVLAGSELGRTPAISPDGKWILFGASGELRRVPVGGGPATMICRLRGAIRGASWGDDNTIVFAASQQPALQRVSASGGEPEVITKPGPGIIHRSPFVLPGSKAILYTASIAAVSTNSAPAIIRVLDLARGTDHVLIESGQDPTYLDGGFISFATITPGGDGRRGELHAVRFDLDRLQLSGDPVALVNDLAAGATTTFNFTTSAHGDLLYVPADAASTSLVRRTLHWVDREGRETPLGLSPKAYATARISPDGSKVALDSRDQTNDIWVWDLNRRTLTPVNLDPAQDQAPIWMPDGKRIVWSSPRGNPVPRLFWQAADGTGIAEQLTDPGGNQFPTSVTSDGQYIIAFGTIPGQGTDMFRIDLRDPKRKAETLLTGASLEFGGELSPDGRYLAYHSNEAGEPQVYVRPYPNVQDRRIQISTDGGTRPVWSRRGDELFYLDRRGLLTSVKVSSTSSSKEFSAGSPKTILNKAYYAGSTALGLDLRGYDVSPDGRRFLVIRDEVAAGAPPQLAELIVTLNWVEELRARLPDR